MATPSIITVGALLLKAEGAWLLILPKMQETLELTLMFSGVNILLLLGCGGVTLALIKIAPIVQRY